LKILLGDAAKSSVAEINFRSLQKIYATFAASASFWGGIKNVGNTSVQIPYHKRLECHTEGAQLYSFKFQIVKPL